MCPLVVFFFFQIRFRTRRMCYTGLISLLNFFWSIRVTSPFIYEQVLSFVLGNFPHCEFDCLKSFLLFINSPPCLVFVLSWKVELEVELDTGSFFPPSHPAPSLTSSLLLSFPLLLFKMISIYLFVSGLSHSTQDLSLWCMESLVEGQA